MPRVFVGVPAPAALRGSAEKVQAALGGLPGVSAVLPEDLHLTIIPPWDERQPDAVARDLAAISSPPVETIFDAAGYGPSAGARSLAWLLAPRTPELDRLWLQTWRAVWSQDPSREALPHVTVARFPERLALPDLPVLPPAAAVLDRVALYESLGGGRYRILAERKLG